MSAESLTQVICFLRGWQTGRSRLEQRVEETTTITDDGQDAELPNQSTRDELEAQGRRRVLLRQLSAEGSNLLDKRPSDAQCGFDATGAFRNGSTTTGVQVTAECESAVIVEGERQ